MAHIDQTKQELKRIDAKRQLNLPLTEREQALWTLYGEQYTATSAEPADKTENDEHVRKALFVKKRLLPLLRDMTDERVADATYIYDVLTHEEYVDVIFTNGFVKRKCVTADSLSAMVADVVQGL